MLPKLEATSSLMPWGVPAHNILIIGATGVIGTYITRAVVDAKHHFGRICVLTSEKTIIEKVQDICALESWGVEVFVGRLEDEKRVKEAYRGELMTGSLFLLFWVWSGLCMGSSCELEGFVDEVMVLMMMWKRQIG